MALGAVSVVFLPTEPAWKVPVPDPADPGELFLPQLLIGPEEILHLLSFPFLSFPFLGVMLPSQLYHIASPFFSCITPEDAHGG